MFFSTQPIEKAWIFGSFARGDERPDSDLDIMATYLPNHRPGLFGISDLIEKLENIAGRKVDLMERGTLFTRVVKEVESQKIFIYERNTSSVQ